MDLEDILQSRNKQIDECRDLIKSLNNIKDSNKCDELKSLLRRKKRFIIRTKCRKLPRYNQRIKNYQ